MMADSSQIVNQPVSCKRRKKRSFPLQIHLPPPARPTRMVSNQSLKSKSVPTSTAHKASNSDEALPSFHIQDISFVSLTKTNMSTPRSSSGSIPYSILPLSDHSSISQEEQIFDMGIKDVATQCPIDNSIHSNHGNISQNNDEPNDVTKQIENNNEKNNDDSGEEEEDKMDPDDDADDEYVTKSVYHRNRQYSYSPHAQYKAQTFITIPRELTRDIPKRVREKPHDLYEFMNKSTAMMLYCKNIICFNKGGSIVLNYDFHDKKTGDVLYCIADKNHKYKNHHRYFMRKRLFTQQDVAQLTSHSVQAPKSSRCSYQTVLHQMHTVQHILTTFISDVVAVTKWNRLRVFNATLVDDKQCRRQYNKQRLTLFSTNIEFDDLIQTSLCNTAVQKVELIPIVMFDECGCEYRVEYVQIVKIRKNVDIGVSYFYDGHDVKVTGIHLNKICILQQHQLVFPDHYCHCLDSFQSHIDDLHIGNPDEHLNRYKDLKKRTDVKIHKLQQERDELHRQLQQCRAQLQHNNMPTQNNTPTAIVSPPVTNQMSQRMPFSQYVMHALPDANYINLSNIQIPQNYNNNMNNNTPLIIVTPYALSTGSSINQGVNGYVSPPNTNTNTNTPTPHRNVCHLNGFPNTMWPPQLLFAKTWPTIYTTANAMAQNK